MYDPIVVSSYKYIDPTHGVNGTGTFADPYNTWGVTNWWVPNTGYLQKAGTTYGAQIVVYNNGPYFIGTYDSLTGNPIRDNAQHAMVRPVSGRALALGTMDTAGRNNISVDNLDLRAPRLNIGFTEGIANTAALATTPLNVQIRRCILDGKYGAQLKGAGLLIEDCIVNGFDSGLNLQSTDLRIRRNRVVRLKNGDVPYVDYDPLWGGITNLLTTGVAPGNLYYEDNYVDGDGSAKEAIHMMYDVGMPAPATTGVIVVRGNKLKGYFQPIYCAYSGALIENNDFDDVFAAPDIPPEYVKPFAISILASNCTVRGNRIRNSPTARFLNLAGATGSTLVEHNSAIGVKDGIYETNAVTAYNLIVRNNLITRAPLVGLESNSQMLWVKTIVNLTAQNNHYDWADGDPLFTANGFNGSFAAYKSAVEPTAQSGAPMIDDNGAPLPLSPLIESGSQGVLTGSRDVERTTRWAPPSIGALEYMRPRPARVFEVWG